MYLVPRMHRKLVPQLIDSLHGYTRRDFLTDATAGVIVGIVALPLAIAFAIASGVSPAQGLYTAIIAGFLISALGGSTVQIGGPTGAFVVIVYGIVQQYGYDGLTVATLMAGVLLVVIGVGRLGGAIKFIPHPVTTGFTSGIAILIVSQQIKDVLGLRMGALPAEFFEKMSALRDHLGSTNWQAVLLAAGTVLIIRRLAAYLAPPAGALRRAARRHDRGVGASRRRGDDRYAIRRDQLRPSTAAPAERDVPGSAHARQPGHHDRAPGGDRVVAVGRGRRRHDWTAAPVQHRARGAGHREHRDAALRRHPGDWRDRSHRDEH